MFDPTKHPGLVGSWAFLIRKPLNILAKTKLFNNFSLSQLIWKIFLSRATSKLASSKNAAQLILQKFNRNNVHVPLAWLRWRKVNERGGCSPVASFRSSWTENNNFSAVRGNTNAFCSEASGRVIHWLEIPACINSGAEHA